MNRSAVAAVPIALSTPFNKDITMTEPTPQSWPNLGAELFDLLTGRRAEITYHLDNMEVHIPAGTQAGGSVPSFAVWKFNGAVRISSRIRSDGA
jgi:hypothetical protein